MLKQCIEKLIARQNLTAIEAEQAIYAMLSNNNTAQIAAFLTLLRAKGETATEILGIVKALRANMLQIPINVPVLDIVGTGGDKANTVNISTGASILAASCGVKVAKHGNRSVSSQCGSADVLETLGVSLEMTPEQVAECIETVGMGFCFAPIFHPAFAKLKKIRCDLAIPTCFNILGPLLNPAQAEYLMIGVFSEDLLDLMAEVLLQLNVEHALVFHSAGIDELSCVAPAKAIEIITGQKKTFILDPQQFGFTKCNVEDLQGGSPQQNAELLKKALSGHAGPITDTLVFNAAVALYIYGKAVSIATAIPIVQENINNGKAIKTLENLVDFSSSSVKSSSITILDKIIQQKQQEVTILKENKKSFKDALLKDGLSVIAEIKRKSPSKGLIADIKDPVKLAEQYAAGGAVAISVLTDKEFFGGSLDDLAKVAKNISCPVLRKDFIVDPLQIAEAVTAGADAILLIVAVLQEKTASLLTVAKQLNIDVLVEVHNKQELDIALASGAKIIGINNRDLRTFKVDINNALELVSHIPNHIVKVAESGITTPAIAKQFYQVGFDAILVGEALIKSKNITEFIKTVREKQC